MDYSTFEDFHLYGQIRKGDYWRELNGEYIVCVSENTDGYGEEKFLLMCADAQVMDAFELGDNGEVLPSEEYYLCSTQDITDAHPEAAYMGNIFKD